ncbi:hypothetical protein SAMN02982996_00619 [Lonsdalea quercina]|uniref:Uncharacterized protein n=1 Tax=Lonsdalea quercina TaxID=71657 RepID=A0A1H3XED9_9GAMM|nr:hypothetical protein SAMN02982996_00619 [Lonsdalea quercina]
MAMWIRALGCLALTSRKIRESAKNKRDSGGIGRKYQGTFFTLMCHGVSRNDDFFFQ